MARHHRCLTEDEIEVYLEYVDDDEDGERDEEEYRFMCRVYDAISECPQCDKDLEEIQDRRMNDMTCIAWGEEDSRTVWDAERRANERFARERRGPMDD